MPRKRSSQYVRDRLAYMREWRKAERAKDRQIMGNIVANRARYLAEGAEKGAQMAKLMQRAQRRGKPSAETANGVAWSHGPASKLIVRGTQFHRADCPTCGPETLHKTGTCCHCGAVMPRKTWLTVDPWVRSKAGRQRAVREI